MLRSLPALLRCAYCHDAFPGGRAKSCPGCGTLLHPGCWAEAGRCPTLGCPRRRLRVIVRPRRPVEERLRGLTAGSLASGVCGAALCVLSTAVLPAFAKMFDEVGLCLPLATELLLGVPTWAWSTGGVLSLLLLILKDRWLVRGARSWANTLFALGVLGAGGCIVWTLFQPLVFVCDRL